MLRASIEQTGADYDLNGIAGDGDGGIPDGRVLIEFAESVIGDDDARLTTARGQLLQTMGAAALVDAAGVVATFDAIDRVADATGTPVEEAQLESAAEIRGELGIDRFPSATSP